MAHSVAGKRLSDFPEIAVEFDVEANGGVTADQIAAGSGTNYWWRCDQGADHVWEAAVGDRTGSRHGCPFCRGLQVSVTNSLATLYPEVAAQLDPDRNGGVTAGQIVAGSGKKYWWRCEKGPDHVWETRVSHRTGVGSGCPFCRGLQVSVTNSLATLYPEVAAQLDPDRNGGVTADRILAGSHSKYWWRCEKGPDHVWEAVTKSRTAGGRGCPSCGGYQISVTNSLAARRRDNHHDEPNA